MPNYSSQDVGNYYIYLVLNIKKHSKNINNPVGI